MQLRVCLFDRDGNEYASTTIIDVADPSNSLQVYDALMESGVFVGSMLDVDREELHYEDLCYLPPHHDEKDTSIVLRVREYDSHEDACNMGAHCSLSACREWYGSNLAMMINLRREKN